MPAAEPDLLALRDLAAQCAIDAGRLLEAALLEDRTEVDTKSTGTDMVTEMDRASERFLVDVITEQRPHDAIVGEEGADRPGTSGVRWVLDPLDGTTNYLYRLPGWNVSVGVEIGDEPVAGAVSVPSHGELFVAAAGHGATCNDRPLRLSEPAPLSTALVGTGFSYEPSVRARQAELLAALLPRVRDIRRVGAAAGDLCALAAGRLDVYVESGLAHWDRSAGTVIAREAGARVELLTPADLPGDLTVAAHPDRWDEVLDLLRAVGIVA